MYSGTEFLSYLSWKCDGNHESSASFRHINFSSLLLLLHFRYACVLLVFFCYCCHSRTIGKIYIYIYSKQVFCKQPTHTEARTRVLFLSLFLHHAFASVSDHSLEHNSVSALLCFFWSILFRNTILCSLCRWLALIGAVIMCAMDQQYVSALNKRQPKSAV